MKEFRRFIPKVISKQLKRIVLEIEVIKFRTTRAKKIDKRHLIAYLLVVKDIQYCFLARVCVLSFLYFHPNSEVLIYSDSATHQKLVRIFHKEIVQKRVKIEPLRGDWNSWQEMKVFVISNLSQSQEFFIDADMRFRGTLPELNNPTVFVREFNLCEVQPFSLLKDYWNTRNLMNDVYMFNSSFIHLGVKSEDLFAKIDSAHFRKFESELEYVIGLSNLAHGAKEQIWRLREQIFLSLAFSNPSLELKTLKQSDARLDGEFLESAYFGSTGLGF